ncbi:MAG: hypothetical protein A4E44_02204 [Methanosaeta sp. PtaB.Bin018]|jgi:hypothetical protein|nr:hypothetical protein [Methanothrix sp.]OPX73989.1 MAG: hypothetical protein A4E44_02204 [Methanosaeta sp. PtaB.Bin018]OPY45622.1 MAG: hypothetical protein A4E46_01201 [Methanosaeta sp. PtaU1.Bin016]
MTRLNLLVVLCLIGFTIASAPAFGEDVEIGPVTVSLDLASAGSHTVEMGESSELEHNYDPKISNFQYSIYPATITFDGTSNQVMIEVHKMSASEPLDEQISSKSKDAASVFEHCIEQSNIMPRRADYQTKSYTIDGHDGILLTVDTGEPGPLYIAAYSPDEKDRYGSIICIIGSDFPWETTEKILESVNTQL